MSQGTIKVQNAAGEEREMTGTQWKLIGEEKNQAGWKPVAPSEASKAANEASNSEGGADDETAILQATRLEYKNLTGEKAGKKTLEQLNEAITAKRAENDEAARNLDNA